MQQKKKVRDKDKGKKDKETEIQAISSLEPPDPLSDKLTGRSIASGLDHRVRVKKEKGIPPSLLMDGVKQQGIFCEGILPVYFIQEDLIDVPSDHDIPPGTT